MKIKAAVIDLYNNEENQGMRCIQDLLKEADQRNEKTGGLDFKIYDSRYKGEVPGLKYDIYISSGGPGNPFDGEGTKWEKEYFKLLDKIVAHNQNGNPGKNMFSSSATPFK